ncbi:hypothetical protein Tco_0445296 [Tanacetum coccineum]
MIGSLMYLTTSRPDIMFAVCACSRFQVTPKTSHLHVVKRIFRYLKGKPKPGLWYLRELAFDLEAFSDSDYAGANLDRKSKTGGCQFLGRRLISWQCKKQTIMATSTTEAEYGAAANCCGQVLWIQNQMLDYGFNFMNIRIYIDNESTICIVKNLVFYSKTKHIEIKHHFIRDAYEKKLIQVLKIHTDNNVVDLLTKAFDVSSSIHFALTVSPIVLTSFVEQFWTTAKSRTINNLSYIDAIIAGKPVTISEASIRSDLLFNDVDGIDTLNNQAIFDAIQLMGKQLKDVPVPMDHFPVPTLTKKVLTFMVKKGKNFSGKVTPLFDPMLVQPIEDEGEVSKRPSESQPILSPNHPCENQPESNPDLSVRPSTFTYIPDLNPEGSGGDHGAQASKIKALKARIKKLKKRARPVIYHHTAWLKATMLRKQLKEKNIKKSKKKRSVSKKGRKAVKSSKGAPSVPTNTNWDDLDDLEATLDEAMEYTLAKDEGKTDSKVDEKGESTAQQQSTDKQNKSTDKQGEGTDRTKQSTDRQVEDYCISSCAMSQIKQKEKEKGVELKNVEDIERPRPTSTISVLTLKPLPKIDPKDKGKKKIEEDESDTESEDINEAEKKFKMLAHDKEIARKTRFLLKSFKKKREMYTIEQRAKFLHDTIAAQRRFLAQQRSEAIRNKPPSRSQLRNQMMTYLKHVGGKKHSDLKTKSFEEIQVLYEKIKRSDDNFIVIGSADDERMIKEMNEQVADLSKKRVKKDDSVKEKIKEEEGTRKRKLGTRKKMKSKKRKLTSKSGETASDTDKDDDELRLCLIIAPDEDKEVDYEILDKKHPIIEWRSEYLTTKPQYNETKELEDVYLNVVIRSNGQRRYFNTLMTVLSIFNREDLNAVYQLDMNRYQDDIPEGFDIILWGDLMIMFHQSIEDEFWNAQQDWKVVNWKLHSSSEVHTLMTETGLVIHMLVENKYPLRKEVLLQMLEIKLESEEDGTMAFELIRFVKKQIAELVPENSDGDEKDLFSIHIVVYNEELAIPEQLLRRHVADKEG